MTQNETFNEYKDRIDTALEDDFLRTAMDNFAVAYRTGRINAFAGMDLDGLVKQVAEIKTAATRDNDRLFNDFKSRAETMGVKVHLAETAEKANEIIADIARNTGSKTIVKSKSMTAEETHLNTFLENRDYEVTETDLGEWIIQLRHEGPSHMVMPAIHLSRHQVADLFSDVTGKNQPTEIESLVKVARSELRQKFIQADMGITGANYAVADTATLGLVTNEGNARLVTTLPRVHVALVGLDKLIPSMADALTVNQILPRNATGQKITSYVTWITGPSECTITPKKTREMHVVFLDNGRRAMAKDPEFSQILSCVRCGACANVCPVYRMVGGHRLGYVYIGAIGLITTYFFHGADKAKHLVQNCTNCGACKTVCAGGINLPKLIKEVHTRIQDEQGHPLKSLLVGKVLKNRKLFHTLLRSAQAVQRPVTGGTPYLRHLPMIFSKDHNYRTLPAIAKHPFREEWKRLKTRAEKPKFKVAIFGGCAQDFVYPEQLKAGLDVLVKAGASVEFPMEQSCCGLPALMMGEKEAAKDVALQNVEAFKTCDADYIVSLCASCASHLKKGVPDLLKETAPTDAEEFAGKVLTFSMFLEKVAGIKSQGEPKTDKKTAWHSPCHLCRGMGMEEAPKELIQKSGFNYVETQEEQTCCGFGGSFSMNFPTVSREILNNKLTDIEKSGCDTLVTECPGCIMQLRGGAERQGKDLKVLHLAEIMSNE
ncbi:MAG: LUD domain-containing protein [Desulfobacterium sp.]|nr:LUD domain-containing protein [Desulfobacterium sp.]